MSNPGITPAELAEIHATLNDRSRVSSHYAGCHLDPHHRDCLARRLLGEVERLRGQLRGLVAAWREKAEKLLAESVDAGYKRSEWLTERAALYRARAAELEGILEDRP